MQLTPTESSISGVAPADLEVHCIPVKSVQRHPQLRSASTQPPKVQTGWWGFAFVGPQYGTVCHQHSVTAVHHSRLLNRKLKSHLIGQQRTSFGADVPYSVTFAPRRKFQDLLTYLLTYLSPFNDTPRSAARTPDDPKTTHSCRRVLIVNQHVCRSFLMSGRNVRWPRRMPPLVSHGEYAVRQTVTLRFPLDLDAASVIKMPENRPHLLPPRFRYSSRAKWLLSLRQ